MNWLDLHMHSNISNDGELLPKDLMKLCSKANLKVVSLTDHNSVRGVEEALYYAKKEDIHLISGIEIDCRFKDTDLHILGYGIDFTDNSFYEIDKNYMKQEQDMSLERMKLVEELGIYFDYDKVFNLARNGVVSGEMIGEIALNDKRNAKNPLITPFLPGGNRDDNPYVNFYWDFCSMGKKAYLPMDLISLAETVNIINNAGGIAVLAHPGVLIEEKEEVLLDIINQGVIGVEVYSSYHNQSTTEFYKEQVNKHNILKTVGSDFHGRLKPAIHLGSITCDNSEDEIYQRLVDEKVLINK